MENGIGLKKERYPWFCHWDVDKYQLKYPAEHWDLCRLFMIAHITKYPEARLAQLTEAFFNMGVHGRCTDPKTDRMVAALAVPVIDYVISTDHDAVKNPFMRTLENKIDSSEGIEPGFEAGGIYESTNVIEEGNSKHQYNLQRGRPDQEDKPKEGLKPSINDRDHKGSALKNTAGSSESQLHSSKSDSSEQHFNQWKQETSAQKRVCNEAKVESDKNQDFYNQKLGSPKQKRRRFKSRSKSPRDNEAPVTIPGQYVLKKLIDLDKLKRLLKGFVIFWGVTKESCLKTCVSILEDSFKYSKFDSCTWHTEKSNECKDVIRVSLHWRGEVLAEAEGQEKEFLQRKIAEQVLNRLSSFSTTIKANYHYYNDGKIRALPCQAPIGPCRYYNGTNHSFDRVKRLIDNNSKEKDFYEMIFFFQDKASDDFQIQDIVKFIEKEKADKLWYRLAVFQFQRKSCPAICISKVHNGQDLLRWLGDQNDMRYTIYKPNSKKLIFRDTLPKGLNTTSEGDEDISKPSQTRVTKHAESLDTRSCSSVENIKSDNNNGIIEAHKDHIKSEKIDSSKKIDLSRSQPASNQEGSSSKDKKNSTTTVHSGSNSSSSQSAPRSSKAVEPQASKQPPTQVSNPISVGKKEKNEELSWAGKEHLSEYAKSIYLVKFVKEDSTTENNPFHLIKTTCSLAFNVDLKFVMKVEPSNVSSGGKQWHVSVVLKHDSGNVLVGEAKASNCTEARLAAAQDAVNTIQANCRVVEPNFNYFAEGGVPSFVSLKHPIKTSTYEIMSMNANRPPLNQEIVNLVLEMFIEDNTIEDLFFLASDFSNEERDLIRKTSIQYGLGWRLFGQRSKASTAEDIVSTQHISVFRIKSAVQLVQQLITCGGSTDKYSVVTKNNVPSTQVFVDLTDEPDMPSTSESVNICEDESFLGGCCNPKCALTHLNILDNVVNQFLGIL